EVESRREALAAHRPDRRIQRRVLEFEPLIAPAAAGLRMPPAPFVAVRGVEIDAGAPVVRLDGLDPVRAAAVIAQADGYAGTYGSGWDVGALLGGAGGAR